MSKTFRVVAVSLLVALLIGAVIWLGLTMQTLRRYERTLTLTYRRAFSELVQSVQTIDAELSKGLNTDSPVTMVALSGKIGKCAETAKNAMAVLPTSQLSLEHTATFLSQVGDFSEALARKAAGGIKLTQEERTSLTSLNQTATRLSQALDELYAYVDSEGFFTSGDVEALENASDQSFVGGLTALETDLPETPVLIYDGPFSGHISQMVPQYLSEGAICSVADARNIAAKFVGTALNDMVLVGQSADPVVYLFSDNTGNTVSVTGVGGHVISSTQSYIPGSPKFDQTSAISLAKSYLSAKGYPDLVSSYAYTAGGICYINFHATSQGVVIYPDLVQVGVAMDTGSVTYFQATGYLNNHRSGRNLAATLTLEQAAGKLAAGYQRVGEGKLCIIPSDGKYETLCYEFLCKGSTGLDYLCYINATTGQEDTVFLLVEDENGNLTI